jgi:hypothetical protein
MVVKRESQNVLGEALDTILTLTGTKTTFSARRLKGGGTHG